jgi:tetratricopeptide (TPR) repeat protein
MKNKNRKRIIPRNKDFTLDGDYLKLFSKRLFRFLLIDKSVPAYQWVEFNQQLYSEIVCHDRHLYFLRRIHGDLRNGREFDWNDINELAGYSPEVHLSVYNRLKMKYKNRTFVLDYEFIYHFCEVLIDEHLKWISVPVIDADARSAQEYLHRAYDRSRNDRLDEAYQDFLKAIELDPDKGEYQYGLAQFLFRHRRDYVKALKWVDSAIAKSNPHRPHEDILSHLLRAEICATLGMGSQVLSSLENATSILRHFLTELDWDENGEALLDGGITLYAEGVRSHLKVTIEVSEKIANMMGAGTIQKQVQVILNEQRKLLKLL